MTNVKKISAEMIAALKKPLPSEAVKPHPTKNFLSSIKAIYVVERLNDVFGIGGWEIENIVVKEEGKWVVVKSTFSAPEYGITIRDIFGGNDNADLGDAYKGACTDALTKIGSYLHIGMDIYKGLGDKVATKEPLKTSSYNRNSIEKNGLPLITNAAFKQAMERLRAGERDVYDKVKQSFSLDPDQERLLTETHKSLAHAN